MEPHRCIFRSRLLISLCATLPLFLMPAGCQHVVQTGSVAQFGTGTAAAKLQLDTAFQSIDDLTQEDELARAVTLPTLSEASVVTVLKPADVQKWDLAFDLISAYVAKLQALLSPAVSTDFDASLVNFGTQLKTTSPNAVPDPGIATAFAEVGGLLIEAKAQHDARAIALHVDPGIRQTFLAMADVLGDGPSKGLRGTTRSHWLDRMADEQGLFLQTHDAAAKKQIVMDYFALRDKRDAQDLQLASLRQSLLKLADAHTALANGSAADLAMALGDLQKALNATQSLHDQFSALKPEKETK